MMQKSFFSQTRSFIIVWFGQMISSFGSGLTSFGLGVWIYLKTGSTSLFAINLLAFTLPSVLLSSWLGTLVDRWDRRKIMLLNDSGSAFVTAVILFLLLTDHLQVWHVYVSTFLNACFNTFQWMAYSASTTMLVPKEHLGRAAGLNQIGDSISMLVSPALAGALFVSWGMQGIILIDFVTFLIAVISLLLIRIPMPEKQTEETSEEEDFWQRSAFGWKYIVQRPGLLGLIIYFASIYFVVGMVEALLEPMLLDMASPDKVGLALSFMGFGAIGGTLLMTIWGGPKRKAFGILLTGVVQGIVMFGFGISPSLVMITCAIFVFSLLDPIVSASSQAFWQIKIPADIQGRVFAVRRVTSRLALAVAIAIAGPLADYVFEPLLMPGGAFSDSLGSLLGTGAGRGIGLLFIVMGVFMTVASLIGLAYKPLRRIDIEIPDAERSK